MRQGGNKLQETLDNRYREQLSSQPLPAQPQALSQHKPEAKNNTEGKRAKGIQATENVSVAENTFQAGFDKIWKVKWPGDSSDFGICNMGNVLILRHGWKGWVVSK